MANILNIEVSERLIKVCSSTSRKKKVRFTKCFTFETPENCVKDGQILSLKVLAERLKEEIENNSLGKVKDVGFVFLSVKIATRELTLPLLNDKQLEKMIDTNASDYFPIDISQYHLTYKILSRDKIKKECAVNVMAVPLDLLKSYFELASLLNLKVKFIESAGNSQYQLLNGLNKTNIDIFVNIDCTETLMSFICDEKLVLQRILAFGGDKFIRTFMSMGEEKRSYLETLQLLTSKDKSELSELTADEARENQRGVVKGIIRSIDYFNTSKWEISSQPQRIILTGSCCKIEGIKDLLAEVSNLDVIYLEDIEAEKTLGNNMENFSSYLSCLGAFIDPMDFLPEQLMGGKKRNKSSERLFILSSIFLFVSIMVSLNLGRVAYSDFTNAGEELVAISKAVADSESAEIIYNDYLLYQKSNEAIQDIYNMTRTPNVNLVNFYEELEEKMPSQILLLSAVCSTDSVSMNVTVPSYEDAGKVVAQFRTFESISDINISGIAENESLTAIETETDPIVVTETVVEFSIVCNYGYNVYFNGENPYEGELEWKEAEGVNTATTQTEEDAE